MRPISSNLVLEQQLAGAIPYVRVEIDGMKFIGHITGSPVYAIGSGDRDIKEYDPDDMSYVQASQAFWYLIPYAMCLDDTNIYMAGHEYVEKYLRADLSYVDTNSPSYGEGKHYTALDEDVYYIWAVGNDTYPLWQIRKTDMAQIDKTAGWGAASSVTEYDAYVFIGMTDGAFKRFLKIDLTSVLHGPVGYGGNPYVLVNDGEYVYAGGNGTDGVGTVRKLSMADLTLVGESPKYGTGAAHILALKVWRDHIYVGGALEQRIKRYLLSDLSYVDQSDSPVNWAITGIDVDDDYVYAGGYSTGAGYDNEIRRYNTDSLSFVDESISYGGDITAIRLNI